MKVCEIFDSIQGEGVEMGIPTVFVRLAGCNLKCKWCDTAYARDEYEEMSLEGIIEKVAEKNLRYVCITGGEPMCQPETPRLISMLVDLGFGVTLETNGSKNIDGLECSELLLISMDIKCPSSGEQDSMAFSNIELLGPTDQLKFVIVDRKDYAYAKEILKEYAPACPVVMTPVGGTDLKDLIKWVLADKLLVRVLPQLHKLVWGNERGR